MKRLLLMVAVTSVFAVVNIAQSGRRVNPKAKTTVPIAPVAGTERDENVYSESRPSTPLVLSRKDKEKPKREIKEDVPTEEVGADTISVESALVNIPVSVFDRNGIYVPNIRESEFKIYEDGVEQTIEYFGNNDQPFTVALVIDTSGSTEFKIEDIHYAAKLFVRQLEPRDRVMVIEFSQGIRVLAEPTNDKEILDKAIDKARFGGATSLYDAVEFTLEKRLNKIEGKKAIVLFTDGVDTSSIHASYDENYRDVEESDTIVYPVFYNTFLGSITGGTVMSSPFPTLGGNAGLRDAKAQTFGKSYLEQLAALTGGRLFDAGRSRNLLARAFQGIAEELRAQYYIGYAPSNVGKKGERKQIKVRVYRPDLRIRARDSYIVGENQK
ncbi:MAG: VWA domain-containing protein [Pyrinomonadaceae bacterium]